MKKLFVFIAIVLVSACAYSPQQITVKPVVDMTGENYGKGRSVSVSAEDARVNKTLGSRGGLYKETSIITIANDMPQAVANAARAKLATQGFNVNSDDSNASLNVVIEELSYDVPEQSVVKKIDLKCVMRVEAKSGGESYTGRYRTTSEQQSMTTPNMERNQQMINQLLSDTLMRAFTDEKLKAFLSNI